MAARTRSNGHKFQGEIERYCKKEGVCIFPVRLRNIQSNLANTGNISDYILFASKVLILEAKETSADSFSLRDFQQKEKVDEFRLFYSKAKEVYGELPYRAAVLVHFIAQGKYTAYFVDEGAYKVMHPDDADCLTADSLPEIMRLLFL